MSFYHEIRNGAHRIVSPIYGAIGDWFRDDEIAMLKAFKKTYMATTDKCKIPNILHNTVIKVSDDI